MMIRTIKKTSVKLTKSPETLITGLSHKLAIGVDKPVILQTPATSKKQS